MLTINSTPSNRTLEARITIPADTTPEDRARLDALAHVFWGRRVRQPDSYVFTEARGRKCFALWQAGFSAVPVPSVNHRACITHPRNRKILTISEAMDFIKMSSAEVVEEVV